jgi:predicted nuclease with TOPRIM domain
MRNLLNAFIKEGIHTNQQVQTMKDLTKKYLQVARWQEVTQNPKVREMQSLIREKEKQKCQAFDEDGVYVSL